MFSLNQRALMAGVLAFALAIGGAVRSEAVLPGQLDFGLASDQRVNLWHETFSTIGQDVKGILRFPRDHPRATRNALLGVGLLVLADKPLTTAYQTHVEAGLSGFSLPRLPWQSTFDDLGLVKEDGWFLSTIGATYLYGALAQDDRAKRASLLSTKAVAYSFVTTQLVLKSLTGRMRPYPDLTDPTASGPYSQDPFDFGHHHGISLGADGYGTAMPSYHFTQYFAVARVYSGIYDNSWVPYGVAGLLAASDAEGHHHWVSDMVAGTLVGIAIGSVVLNSDEQYRRKGFALTPYPTQDGAGLEIQTKF